jgi:hypothetical protein
VGLLLQQRWGSSVPGLLCDAVAGLLLCNIEERAARSGERGGKVRRERWQLGLDNW